MVRSLSFRRNTHTEQGPCTSTPVTFWRARAREDAIQLSADSHALHFIMGILFSCCHNDDALEPLKEPLTAASDSAESPKKFDEAKFVKHMTRRRDMADCAEYQPNLQAAFGECVCGRPRADHSEEALKAGGRRTKKSLDEVALREQMTHRQTADCVHYKPNLNAAAFGECECGRPRAEHSRAALQSGERPTSPTRKLDEAALREQRTRRETVNCLEYQPNLTARTFGECMCGQPRALHTNAALEAGGHASTPKRLDEAGLREQMALREKAARSGA